jgi:hypothetical protein
VLQSLRAEFEGAQGQISDLKETTASADAALSERISTTQAAVGDNAAAIASETTARADGDTALSQRIDTVSSKTDKAAADITGLQKTVADGDSALATRIDGLQTTVGQNGAAITSEATARANADTALGQRIDAVVSTAGGNTAAIASEAATRASADSALGTRIDSVTATAGSNKAAIAAESTARVEGDAAVAKQVTDLRTDMQTADSQLQGNITQLTQVVADSNLVLAQRADRLEVSVDKTASTAIENALNLDERGQVNRQAFARITNDQQVTASEVKAQAQVLQRLDVGLGNATGQIADLKRTTAEADTALSERISTTQAAIGDNAAAIASEATARAGGDTVLGQRIDTVSSKTDRASSDITLLQKTVADGDSALATRIDGLQTKVGQNSSAITSESTARANADTALGQRIDTVTATAGENKSAVQQVSQAQATLDGKLSASWNLKVNTAAGGNNYVAGLGLGIEPDGKSQFLVQADRMALINTANGKVTTPFAIQNGQTFINSAVIADGSIVNAKIGDYIQSNNYLAGSSGWKINKSGEAEFQNGRFRGHVEATSGTFSGTLNAVDGTFTGTIYAENIIGDIVSAGVWAAVRVTGVNETTHRYFTGGLPYTSIVIVPYAEISVERQGYSGAVYIKVNGVDYWRGFPSVSGGTFKGPIVIEVPPNGTLDVEFTVTGTTSGLVWSGGKMSVMAFRKGTSKFN